MASNVLPCGIRVYHFGPVHAPLTIVYFNGFIGRVTWPAGLTLGSDDLRSDSMFWWLLARGDVHIVLVEHPSRPIQPDVDFPQLHRCLGNRNLISGLSRGAQVASDFYRWIIARERVAAQNMGLFMISPPADVNDLCSNRLARLVQLAHVPCWLGRPVMRRFGLKLFPTARVESILIKAGRERDVVSVRESIKSSSWVVATTRALATYTGFGPAVNSGSRVVVANVSFDEIVFVAQATEKVLASYPDAILWHITWTSGHGLPDVDATSYRELWIRAYAHFAELFHLAT